MDKGIKWLAQLLTPKEASAEVVGDKATIHLLSQIIAESDKGKLPEVYKHVVQKAQDVPEVVSILEQPGLKNVHGYYGKYQDKHIMYDPFEGDVKDTVTHELLHFLNNISKQPLPTVQQHDVIYPTLRGETLNDEQYKLLRQWIGQEHAK